MIQIIIHHYTDSNKLKNCLKILKILKTLRFLKLLVIRLIFISNVKLIYWVLVIKYLVFGGTKEWRNI